MWRGQPQGLQLPPQQTTLPSPRIPQVWFEPALTCVKVTPAGGVLCPYVSAPQSHCADVQRTPTAAITSGRFEIGYSRRQDPGITRRRPVCLS